MMPTISRMNLDLTRDQGVRIANALGTRIECRSGALWITLDNDPRDVLLDAGQWFVLDSPGDAIVQAILGPAEVAVMQGCNDAAAPRVQRKPPVPFLHGLRAALRWNSVGAR